MVLNVEPYTTIKELVIEILKKLEKTYLFEFFGIYEIAWHNGALISESYLDNDCFILDRVNSLEKMKKKNLGFNYKLKFFFRIRIFYKFEQQDLDSIEFLYSQSFSDVVQNRIFTDQEVLFNLLGICMNIDYGPFDMDKSGKLTLNLERYVPAKCLLSLGAKLCFEKIMKAYSETNYASISSLKIRFLKVMKENDIFFVHHFEVMYSKIVVSDREGLKSKKNKTIVVIKPLIFEILEENKEKVVYNFDRIFKWAIIDEMNFVVYTNDNEIHVFNGNKIKEIEFLINSYVKIAIRVSGL